ncbi:ABC transporter substrate-binding protein [Citricoccus sp. K5]|uniref:ABC transporter substrate-binding protein n=1 Tax=Citricoccus sp. K5 TaxID=2653135 RepID=UPI0012F2FC2E|nr:ABC transporter substrate-binding protein [Citricoccus sp. K5]VXB92167.1 NitT/TauT family transport system substrate-binding protein [Citricoccus sp. K5]
MPTQRLLAARRRSLLAAGVLSVAALTLTACGSGSPSSAEADTAKSSAAAGEGSDALEAVNIGYFPLVHTSTLVNADEQGYLEDAGIDAELTQTQGGAAAIPALASGNVDITYANYTSALLAAQQGLPIVLIAGNDVGADDHGIYVDPDSGIEEIADLKGKSFAVNNLQNIGTVALYAQLEEAGLSPADVEVMEMPYPDMAAAVQNGNVDAVWQVEPFQAVSEKEGLVKIGNLFAGPAEEMPVAGWITTREYADSHPEVIDGLRSALSSSMEDLDGNREAFSALVPEFTTVTAEVVQEIELPVFSAELDLEKLQQGADLMLEYDLIDEALDVQGTAYTD